MIRQVISMTALHSRRSGRIDAPLKVLHLIGDTDVGGAEMVLYNIVSRLPRGEFDSRVVSLLPIGSIGHRLRAQGINVESLGLTRRVSAVPQALRGFARSVREYRPDVVQTWMYHADLLGGIAARCVSSAPVVWSVHHASLNRHTESRNTRMSASLCSRLSRTVPARIAVVSESARRVHEQAGYDSMRLTVIRNGFDVGAFRPDPAARVHVRTELGLAAHQRLIGLIGRFHPHKDHETFVRAASRIAPLAPHALFVCAGADADWNNPQLCGWIESFGLRERFRLLGQRDDVPQLMAGLDLAVCCSRTEAFPSVVGEAMACEVPCIVTDVGDCRDIVGDAGMTVLPGSPDQLADAVLRALSLPAAMHAQWGRAARRRIIESFTIEKTVRGYTDVWSAAIAEGRGRRGQRVGVESPVSESIAA